MHYSRLTTAFIGFMVVAAAVMTANAAIRGGPWHPYLALTLLTIAVATSRMKVTIPGINGSMSMSLPFLMLSVLTLSPIESVLIAVVSSIVQTLPRDGSQLKPVRVLFNASMMAFASGMAAWIAHLAVLEKLSWGSAQLLLVATTATFFLGQTVPVSVIVGLTEAAAIRKTWTNLAQMSFPYYVLSAGVTSMVSSAGHYIGWLAALALFPVMFGIYRSYRLYFARAAQHLTPALAMAAGAGAHS